VRINRCNHYSKISSLLAEGNYHRKKTKVRDSGEGSTKLLYQSAGKFISDLLIKKLPVQKANGGKKTGKSLGGPTEAEPGWDEKWGRVRKTPHLRKEGSKACRKGHKRRGDCRK